MFTRILFKPLKMAIEAIAAIFFLYAMLCTALQSYQFYQGGRTAWMTVTSYQTKLEQAQNWNPFD